MSASPSQDIRWRLRCSSFAREALGFVPDDWQTEVLDNDDKLLLNVSRQSGKTTSCSIRAIWTALYRPKSLIVCFAQDDVSSKDLLEKCVNWLDVMRDNGLSPVPIKTANKHELRFTNGSRLIAKPGQNPDAARGLAAPAIVLIDEAAYVHDGVFLATFPMVATNRGQLILMSTPKGKTGFFSDLWHSDADDWKRIKVEADQISRIPPERLAEYRAVMSDAQYRQEFRGEFLQSASGIFDADVVRAAMKSELSAGLDSRPKPTKGVVIK